MLAAPTLATAKPIEVRVVIVTTWNVDLNGKDTYGELHAWRTRWPLTTELPFPLGVHPLLYDAKRHVLAILTGEATARAAARSPPWAPTRASTSHTPTGSSPAPPGSIPR